MNLKAYYQRIRDVEQTIGEPFVVLVSHTTPDGGKEGVLIEAPAQLGAKMIADGRAHLASPDQAREFRQKAADAKRLADDEAAASRMQVTIVPAAELRKGTRPVKD